MNKKYVKTLFSRSGNGVLTTRVSIPIQWLLDLGVTVENRDLELNYDKKNGQIIIKKFKGEIAMEFEIYDVDKRTYYRVEFEYQGNSIWEINYPSSSGARNRVTLDINTLDGEKILETTVFHNFYYRINWGNTAQKISFLLSCIESYPIEFLEEKLRELEKIQSKYNEELVSWVW
ncbi:MAG: hypothetical protein ACRCZO_01125 [Cetobacterium sp.]|uniref:hypothetical protein n=1 Tax=Cetobacterium sp. TaxID=2071632 RepID=UPI003EE5306F